MSVLEYSADSFFTIGDSHSVCQDYALSSDKLPFASLSDGCSSNPHSDIGSRILVSKLNHLVNRGYSLDNSKEFAFKSKFALENLGYSPDNLNATLMSVGIVEEDGVKSFKVQGFGDGLVVARYRDSQDFYVTDIKYPSGAPFYLSYLTDDRVLNGWKNKYSPKIELSTYNLDCEKSTVTPIMDLTLDKGFKPENGDFQYSEEFDLDSYDLVLAISDGIHSFTKKDHSLRPYSRPITSDVPFLEILPCLLDFKVMNGVFIQRRMSKFLEHCKKNNLSHYDDLSIAGLYVKSF